MLNIVLVEPEIPQNTGNIVRTAAATGCKLHLVRPLGFDISDRALKRAGLDYWSYADFTVWNSLGEFLAGAAKGRVLGTPPAAAIAEGRLARVLLPLDKGLPRLHRGALFGGRLSRLREGDGGAPGGSARRQLPKHDPYTYAPGVAFAQSFQFRRGRGLRGAEAARIPGTQLGGQPPRRQIRRIF